LGERDPRSGVVAEAPAIDVDWPALDVLVDREELPDPLAQQGPSGLQDAYQRHAGVMHWQSWSDLVWHRVTGAIALLHGDCLWRLLRVGLRHDLLDDVIGELLFHSSEG
jgi:hypothetical protein